MWKRSGTISFYLSICPSVCVVKIVNVRLAERKNKLHKHQRLKIESLPRLFPKCGCSSRGCCGCCGRGCRSGRGCGRGRRSEHGVPVLERWFQLSICLSIFLYLSVSPSLSVSLSLHISLYLSMSPYIPQIILSNTLYISPYLSISFCI